MRYIVLSICDLNRMIKDIKELRGLKRITSKNDATTGVFDVVNSEYDKKQQKLILRC